MKNVLGVLLCSTFCFTMSLSAQAPDGMVLIPAGEFQMGSADGESVFVVYAM